MSLIPYVPVRSPRLELRFLTDGDVPALVAYRSQPEVCRYVPFEPQDEAIVRERLADLWFRTQLDEEGEALTFGVVRRSGGEVIGDLMLRWESEEHGCAEIGYVFHPGFGGQGYATEAAHALLHIAFDQLGFRRAVARLDARNGASAALCRRLGMRQEAHFVLNEWWKGELTDELDFGMLSSEWVDQHASGCPFGFEAG